MKKPKLGKITCEVPGCDCAKTIPLVAEVKRNLGKSLVRAPWNPGPRGRAGAAGRKSAPPRPARPAPGDRSLPVALTPDITPYARPMGRFTKAQAARAERDFQKFLKLRARNTKQNIGKGEVAHDPIEDGE